MSVTGIDVFDATLQKTNEWLQEIAQELGTENRQQAYVSCAQPYKRFATGCLSRRRRIWANSGIEHPFGKIQFATRVRMYKGLRRIDISTDLLNEEPWVRYRVLFPTSIPKGTATYEIPFGVMGLN